ncbi:MAG: DNA repair protein RecO [Flavobacteriales bacterium]|nr:MAG: DNA repair protein RecO [Flavobacteriales bacterium]
MLLKTGFLLSYVKYGDNDAVIHCFTQSEGYESFFVKGIYTLRNKKKAYLSPLNEIQLQVHPQKGGNLATVSKINLVSHLQEPDIKISSILFFVADFLNQMLKNERNAEPIYQEIQRFLTQLKKRNFQSHLVLLLIFIELQGFFPLINNQPFINPISGESTHEQAHHFFDAEVSMIWSSILTNDNQYDIKINNRLRKKVMDSILLYFTIHFPDFKRPKSLEILQQIFEN